jgi:hypothetical protein
MFVVATGCWLWLLERLGAYAITMPWGRVYVRREFMSDLTLRAHELVHLEQIERLGPWKFSIVYLWQWARHGYFAMPLEAEADRREVSAEMQRRALATLTT